ncbi:MAG TPA: DUF6519 domain-containing protein [Caldimonas sp.]
MKGDFSRISFNAKNHFSRVLLQQGRVTLDADPNEEGAILLHYLRTLARDLIGPCGGPIDAMGFELSVDTTTATQPKLMIGAGRYYVDGILVENDAQYDYAHQPDLTPPADDALLQWLKTPTSDVWLYLDVWERHISWIENDAIRESALGGPDTCTRAKVVWQVRAVARAALIANLTARRDAIDKQLADTSVVMSAEQRAALQARRTRLADDIIRLSPAAAGGPASDDCSAPLDSLDGLSDAQMTARLDPGQLIKDPCVLPPDALYRGVENQLYRVEVHRGSAPGATPTFKWSRDNGSVAARWLGTEGNDLVVSSARGFAAGAWVELTDESDDLTDTPGLLVKLAKVDADRLSVDPASVPSGASIALAASAVKPKVRRWDQTETDDTTLDGGAVPLVEAGAGNAHWLDLEDGIQVQFAAGGSYRSGDYWLIPARVATGSIEWPSTPDANGNPLSEAQPPRGVQHHYASLGFVAFANNEFGITPCLCEIEPVNSCSRPNQNRDTVGTVATRPAVKRKTTTRTKAHG